MSYEFYDCFKSCDEHNIACNWTVLQNSDLSHLHRQWEKGKYVITVPGNRHLPNVPEMEEFTVAIIFAVEDNLATSPELKIFFGYQELQRAGYFICCRLEGGQCVVSLGREHGDTAQTIASKNNPFDASKRNSPWKIKLCVRGKSLKVNFEDCALFEFDLPDAANIKGRIGFDRGTFVGSLELNEVKITSTEDIFTKVLLPETEVVFPPDINGFHTPLRYKFCIRQFGDTARLDLELSGSDKENPDVPWFPYHGLIIDFLTAPYLRIGEQRLYPTGQDTLVLAEPNPVNQKYFYEALYSKPEWPLQASFFLAEVPKIDRIGVGYEYCDNEAGSKHLNSGPNEAIFDIASHSLVYAGAAVRKGTFILELHSQPDKEICNHIPKSDPRYEAALAFARRNHFFMEAESCRFKTILRFDDKDITADDINLSCVLENAFTEELETIERTPFVIQRSSELGFTEFIAELPSLTLHPGVYHLRFELTFAGKSIISQRHSFEIMSANPNAPAAPLLSGLPFLFSMPNEIKGLEQDQFEPYLNVENNISHYLSMTTHYPDVGRKHRIDEILKIYHRKWFLWLTDRVTEHPDLELYGDVARKCDYIHPPVTEPVYEMWKPQTYRGELLQLLIDFLRSDAFISHNEEHLTLEKLELIEREKVLFPEAAIEELVNNHWMPWLNFFGEWHVREEDELQKRLRSINPKIKRASYGPMNIYVAHGKTNHVLKYRGKSPQFYDGFFVFEDYPMACKYNIHRGPFLLTALKMTNPEVKIYPEVYSSGKQGCPDGAVNYAYPPFGVGEIPAIAEKKRFLEYAYAVVWFNQGEFHYWQDNGFHARAWPREYFDVMLDSWKFINHAKPVKPLRSTAYVYSDVLCENHPAYYEYSKPNGYPWGDIYNTAEETISYAWETARIDGQQSGFLCALESLHELSPEDVGLLVLPPLCGATREQLDAIRRLHEQGTNLLAFENVEGLEDIFGVEPLQEPQIVNNICVNDSLPNNPLAKLGKIKEYTEHPLCRAKYRAKGADVLLQGEAPVLFINQSKSGKAALFNIPPSVVRRDSFYERAAYGRGSISELMNQSVAMMQRELGAPAVTTTAGKVLSFEDQNGNCHIIVMEDAFPDEPTSISTLISIQLPDIHQKKISCAKPFQVISSEGNSVMIRLQLDVHECAIITVGKGLSYE